MLLLLGYLFVDSAKPPFHGCCWETFCYIFAYGGLGFRKSNHLTAKN